MSEIDFIWPFSLPKDRLVFDKISLALVAPQPYIQTNKFSVHLYDAIAGVVLELDAQKHINLKSGKPFDCISYYADDWDVVAYCAAHEDVHLATIGAPFVRRLVKICNHLGLVLQILLPKHGGSEQQQHEITDPEQDSVLAKLLLGDMDVSESEADKIVAPWPANVNNYQSGQRELRECTLFYDLIRLIWFHEWAHALCGHVSFASSELLIARLHEFSAERVGDKMLDKLGYPRNEVLQSLEMHADEFAIRLWFRQILEGRNDPFPTAGEDIMPNVPIVERLMILNTAFCIFAVMWSLAERRFSPSTSFYPAQASLTSNQSDSTFATFNPTHPPAVFRYFRFHGFQQELTQKFTREPWLGLPNPRDPTLQPLVDFFSFKFLDKLGSINKNFYDLRDVTSTGLMTPTIKRLIAYEAHLLEIGEKMAPWLIESGFVPTGDLGLTPSLKDT